jgi:hypothetical protein
LRPLLTDYLDLTRFQKASAAQGLNDIELDRIIALTPEQARGLLRDRGLFQRRGAGRAPRLVPTAFPKSSCG